MKAKSFFRMYGICLSFSFLLLGVSLSAQELEQLISSKFEVIDEQDHQFIDCNTFRFGDEVLYDNPNVVRLYENGAYRFDLNFSYFADNEIINPSNYLDKFYSITVPESAKKNYRVTAISPKGNKLSIYAIATGDPGVQDTFRIQLLDKEAQLLADAIYPFEVREDIPGANETAFLPMKMEYKPIFVRLEEVDNPNNSIERQLLPFAPDTINIDAKEAFNFITQIEEDIQIGDQSYVLVADHEKDYGYKVKFEWQGKSLRDKPNSTNGLMAYLTTVPGRNRPGTPTLDLTNIMAADLKKAGLDQSGKRVKQEYVFVQPNTTLTKVYQANFIKENPDVIRNRQNQKTTQFLLNKYLPAVQNNFKEANQKVFKYYQMSPQQMKIIQQNNKATKVQAPVTNKPVKTQPSIQKYQVVTPQKNTNTKAKEAIVRDHRRTTVSPDRIRDHRANTGAVRRNQTVIATRPTPSTPKPGGNYYTLAIEVSRETDVMSHRTYFLTFRLVE